MSDYDEESVISMWREMISDMKRELGNNPSLSEKYSFENQWMKSSAPVGFRIAKDTGVLCRYTEIKGGGCKKCPIFWGFENLDYNATCMDNGIYDLSTLDELLNLPAKNISELDELNSYDTNFFDI